MHATNVAPPVVQGVQNQVGGDIQSPASTPEAEASPFLETEASMVYQYVFNQSHISTDTDAYLLSSDVNLSPAAVELPVAEDTTKDASHQNVKQQLPAQQAFHPQPPSGDVGPRTLAAMASFDKTPAASLERMAAKLRIESSRGGRGGHRS